MPTRFRHFPASFLWFFIGIGYFDRKRSVYSGRLVRVGAREILNSAKSSWPRNPSNTLNNHVCTNSVKFQIKVHSISATARIRKKTHNPSRTQDQSLEAQMLAAYPNSNHSQMAKSMDSELMRIARRLLERQSRQPTTLFEKIFLYTPILPNHPNSLQHHPITRISALSRRNCSPRLRVQLQPANAPN